MWRWLQANQRASRLISAACARYNNLVTRSYTAGGELGGRLKVETQTIGGTPYSLTYAYDAANRQMNVNYPDGSGVARAFTDRNQLQQVWLNAVNVASFIYDNGGRRNSTTFGNNLVETRTYRTDNLNDTIGIPGVTNFTYTWDANKRKLSEADAAVPLNGQSYGYDDEDRLTGFNRQNGDSQSWNLSKVGDWNTFNKNGNLETRQHNSVHELNTINANPLVYDPKGNLTANSNGQSYIWDFENRMKQATVPTGAPGVEGTHTYAYDALGRRVSKTVGTLTTVFINDGLQEIAEYENGTLARSYVFGSYIDEPLLMVAGGVKTYYHANNLYSVAALTDQTGTVVERMTYDPYGKVKILAADGVTVLAGSSVGNPWTFTGRRLDGETGLMYYRTRMYSAELGRFLQRDQIDDVENHMNVSPYSWLVNTYAARSQSVRENNLYMYVRNNPITFVDPWGFVACTIDELATCTKTGARTIITPVEFLARSNVNTNTCVCRCKYFRIYRCGDCPPSTWCDYPEFVDRNGAGPLSNTGGSMPQVQLDKFCTAVCIIACPP